MTPLACLYACMYTHVNEQTGQKHNAATAHPMGQWRHKIQTHFSLLHTAAQPQTVKRCTHHCYQLLTNHWQCASHTLKEFLFNFQVFRHDFKHKLGISDCLFQSTNEQDLTLQWHNSTDTDQLSVIHSLNSATKCNKIVINKISRNGNTALQTCTAQ